jgi:hypothetical protein
MTKWRECSIVIKIWLKNDYKSFDMNIGKPTPRLPTYLPTHTPINLPTYHIPTYLYIYLPTYHPPHLPTYLFKYPPTHPSTHLFTCYLNANTPTHDPLIYLPIHPPIYLLQVAYLFTYLLLPISYNWSTSYLPSYNLPTTYLIVL